MTIEPLKHELFRLKSSLRYDQGTLAPISVEVAAARQDMVYCHVKARKSDDQINSLLPNEAIN